LCVVTILLCSYGDTRMLPLTEQLSVVAQAYAKATGTALATVSTKLFNGGGRLAAIIDGGDLNTRNFEKAMGWFSANWPETLEWPSHVPRPASVEPAAA